MKLSPHSDCSQAQFEQLVKEFDARLEELVKARKEEDAVKMRDQVKLLERVTFKIYMASE